MGLTAAYILSSLAILLGVYAAFIKKPKEAEQVDLSGLKSKNALIEKEIELLEKELIKKPNVVKDAKGSYSLVHGDTIIKTFLE